MTKEAMWKRVFRLRTLVYGAILGLIVLLAAVSLAYRIPLKVDVIRDRAMPKVTEVGAIENVYRLQIMNTQEAARNFQISVKGIPGATIVNEAQVSIKAATSLAFPVRVRVPAGAAPTGSNRIRFVVSDSESANISVTEKAVFLVPR